MNRFVVLLRGINVSGKNKLPMQDLRDLLNNMGYKNVQTYIQSGNIILDTEKEKGVVGQEVKEAIQDKFGYDVPVIVKTSGDLSRIIENNPYPVDNEKVVLVVFLSDYTTTTHLEMNKSEEDQFTILDDVVYFYCPNGFGKSKLTIHGFEKKLELKATSRNWRTTNKLLELVEN